MRRDLGARGGPASITFPITTLEEAGSREDTLFTITKGIALVKASTLRSELFEQGLW